MRTGVTLKTELERMNALKELDEVISWLGKTGRLTGGNLLKTQRCLMAIAQEHDAMEARDAEHDEAVRRLTADIATLKSLLRCTGYSEKAIAEAFEMGDDFLNKELRHIQKSGNFIQDSTAFELLRSYKRSFGIRIEMDLFNLRFYQRLLEIASESMDKSQKIKPHIQFLRETYGHLERFFDMADDREEIPEESTKSWLYTYYLNN